MIQSKALEVNLASTNVDVIIKPEYRVLQEILSEFYGLAEGLNTFLKELSHPYRNWQFIVREARGYSLDYFHLLKKHPKGPDTARMFVNIFCDGIESVGDLEVKTDAADNLILFLQKIIKETGPDIVSFVPVLNQSFQRIEKCRAEDFFLFLKSYYHLKRMFAAMLTACRDIQIDYRPLNSLLNKYFQTTYAYWLEEEDPRHWFERELSVTGTIQSLGAIFEDITHAYISGWKIKLAEIAAAYKINGREMATELMECPGYSQFVDIYRKVPERLYSVGREFNRGYRWKLIFIFHIMNISGLSMIHEEMLHEINRTLTWLIGNEEDRVLRQLVDKTFSILRERTNRFPATALNCVLNMGKAIYQTDDSDLVNSFIDSLIALGFQTPRVGGVGNDWQIKANYTHVQNIRTWLEIIELNPKWSSRLLSALIIHLALSGVFVKDTDLFPRDMTRLLNADIGPVYNLVKQLARLLPVFFNDIGAEGELREISTEIDEISYRKDVLIHFLRKQSHVESSNRIVFFMEATLDFWKTRKKSVLKPYVPPAIYSQIKTEGEFIDGVHQAMIQLAAKGVALPRGLLNLDEDRLTQWLTTAPGVGAKDLARVKLVVAFYKLLNQKYSLSFVEMDHYLAQLKVEAFPDLHKLKEALAEGDLQKKIIKLTDYLDMLLELILSRRTYEIREDIYKKRHFTIDIPSMYGSYHEVKFDALGLTFRIESILNVLFEELVESVDLSLITKSTFFNIYDCLKLFNKALNMDGVSSSEIDHQLDFLSHSLEVRGFTSTQYLDIFKGFAQAVKNIINDYFNNIHETNLDRILSMVAIHEIQPKYLPHGQEIEPEKLKHRVSEIFFRERIIQSPGLQQLDLFISRILNTLFQQSKKLQKENLQRLLLYDHQRAISGLEHQHNNVSGIIHLGNKGLNLVKLRQCGLPVPPGFIITTEVFRSLEVIENYAPAEQNLKEQIGQQITLLEKTTGKSFGNLKNPLLFSVRSGSAISQPGMMDTFLDVGINEDIAAGIAEQTAKRLVCLG